MTRKRGRIKIDEENREILNKREREEGEGA
jgi:hypothetical protein